MKNIAKLVAIVPFVVSCTNSMEITGVVKVKGSAPHTYLVIEDSKTNQDYQIKDAKKYHLEQKQNKTIKVKAKVVKKSLGAAFPAVIEILEVK